MVQQDQPAHSITVTQVGPSAAPSPPRPSPMPRLLPLGLGTPACPWVMHLTHQETICGGSVNDREEKVLNEVET